MRLPISDSDLLCLDLDERSLRMVTASLSRSGVRIRTVVSVPVPPEVNIREAASVGEFIRKSAAEHRIRARRVVAGVPREDAVLNMMPLPRGSVSELAAMVHMQIGKELPFSKDQAVVDFAVTEPAAGTSTLDVWVAAVRSNVIDHLQQVLTAANLRIERIGLRPYASTVALVAAGHTTGRVLMVDVGPSMTEIDVVRDGRLVYSRAASVSIPQGGLDPAHARRGEDASRGGDAAPTGNRGEDAAPTGRPSPMDALIVEVSRTIEAYRATDPGARIDRIVLAGTEVTARVAEAFESRFGSTTSIYEVPQPLRWRSSTNESAAPYSAAIGLALSMADDASRCFNFHKPKQEEDERREKVRQVPRIAAVVALFAAAAGVVAWQPIHRRSGRLAALQQEIDQIQAGQKARKELMDQLKDVTVWQEQNVVWLDRLKEIADHVFKTNKDAYLTQIEFSDKGEIKIKLVETAEKVTIGLADAAEAVKDKHGARIYRSTVGEATKNPKAATDPNAAKYPIQDEFTIYLKSLTPTRTGT